MEAFWHGFILAFGLIMPLGVQNLFIFNQGVTQPSLLRALPVVITAGICDTLLILAAVLGLSLVILNLGWLKVVLMASGAAFLLYMGWLTWNNTANIDVESGNLSARKQIMFAASVSLLNPHAIMDTIGVIGTSSLNYSGHDKVLFTAACILVSWCWFLGLAMSGRFLGRIDTSGRFLVLVNKVSAVLIWLAAFYLGLTGLSAR